MAVLDVRELPVGGGGLDECGLGAGCDGVQGVRPVGRGAAADDDDAGGGVGIECGGLEPGGAGGAPYGGLDLGGAVAAEAEAGSGVLVPAAGDEGADGREDLGVRAVALVGADGADPAGGGLGRGHQQPAGDL